MNTEQKIKEAFEAWWIESDYATLEKRETHIEGFRAGYLALLNSLERYGVWHEGATIEESDYFPPSMTPGECDKCTQLYRLPEGVTKP